MSKPKILIQLDTDPHASVFDAVVALDAGVEQLLQYHAVEPTEVRELIHGAIFTRGPDDLHRTAVAVGGADVAAAEALLKQVTNAFFGPMRVSVLFDANGSNTTAAAAVLSAARHLDLADTTATVFAATGPVGQRVVRLLAQEGTTIRVTSRSLQRAEAVCRHVDQFAANGQVKPFAVATWRDAEQALAGSQLVVAAGAVGTELVSKQVWSQASELKVAIDLNAVPPAGIGGLEPPDHAETRDGVTCYGAIGVGRLKMKIHKAAIEKLFEKNDQVLDAEHVLDLGRALVQ